MTAYCLVGSRLLSEWQVLRHPGQGWGQSAALEETDEALDAHCAECEDCRRASGLDAWAAEYDNAEHDNVPDNVEY